MKRWTGFLFPLLASTAATVTATTLPQYQEGFFAYGESVAQAINARYEDYKTVRCGDGDAAYYCSGVIIRGVNWSPDYYFWTHAQRDDGYFGVSFSYLRKDMGTRMVARNHGFIFRPAQTWGRNGVVPISMLCSFPYDAVTGPMRGKTGCGAHTKFPEESRPCAEQGIDTVSAFAIHYTKPGHGAWTNRGAHQCSFGTDWRSFHLSILARQGGALEPFHSLRYSEQVIGRWPTDAPENIPLEALFYYMERGSDKPRENGKALQRDYFNATGIRLPLLQFHADMTQPAFTFHPEDQQDPVGPRQQRSAGATPRL